ncbi:MAG: DEAD/DEAH box helicase [Deltaproteobacteria bacterium]|jgi:superfamily II RNA helicase|nr:DEAD/DEAH box helicase [Deltaproteobacteria bacterium]
MNQNRPAPPPNPFIVDGSVQKYLANIGRPEEAPFVPDPFQLEAIELIKGCDVIVSAPTGSGKTWIAEKAIEHELSLGNNTWYASPLKALSNSKFLEFGKIFGQDNVGLLTGDHKVNTDAPVVVGTTEILRNQLYDSMISIQDVGYNLVILDEAHYLGDKERGVVWEEVLIYMPERVRLLLLSATIRNAKDIASWLTRIRSRKVKVVQGGSRPVPLIPLCLQGNHLRLLQKTHHSSSSRMRIRKWNDDYRIYGFGFHESLMCLHEYDLLPAIYFLKSRGLCNRAVAGVEMIFPESKERYEARQVLIEEYLSNCPLLEKYHDIKSLRIKAVAAHHAGNLPQFKFLVEELMTKGLLSVIFATSTVSAGVNFPARSVVIPQSDRFNGIEFSDLTALELAQMTGRAGRRGRDMIGFALIMPSQYTSLGLMNSLFKSPPNPITSCLNINFSMLLNLLDAFSLGDVKYLLSKSFMAWQAAKKKTRSGLTKAVEYIWKEVESHLDFLMKFDYINKDFRLTGKGKIASKLRLDFPLVYTEAILTGDLDLSPPILASVVASIIGDKPTKNYFTLSLMPPELRRALITFSTSIQPMTSELMRKGFRNPSCEYSKCWAIYKWATENNLFSALHALSGKEEVGDFVRLALLTVEFLNQIRSLAEEFPTLAENAKIAKNMLLKPPII